MRSWSTDEQTSKAVLPVASTMAGTWGQKGQESNCLYFWCLELKYFWDQSRIQVLKMFKPQLLEAWEVRKGVNVGPGERRAQMERESWEARIPKHDSRILGHSQIIGRCVAKGLSVGPCLSLCCQWKCVLLGVSGPSQPLANEGQVWYTKNSVPQPNGSRCICLSKSIYWASAVSQELAWALRGASLIYTPLCIWSAAFLAFLPGSLTGPVLPPVVLEARA